jgi:predicted amidohydrolase
MSEKLVNEAAEKGAKWIILPEFFTIGMTFDDRIIQTVLPPDGKTASLLINLAKRHNAFVGGHFYVATAMEVFAMHFFLLLLMEF